MTDYATATQCKAFTRLTFEDFRDLTTGQFDTFVALLAGYASRAMETFCGNRDWAAHDDSATGVVYDVGPQNIRMIPIKGPVITITSVEIRDGPGASWTTLDTDLYTYVNFPKFGPVYTSGITHLKKVGFGLYTVGRLPRYAQTRVGTTSWNRWRDIFWRGYDDVRVKYTWGYATIPPDINRICVMIVDDWLKKALKDEVGKRVKAVSPEEIQTIMRYEIPEHLRLELREWKNTGGMGAV